MTVLELKKAERQIEFELLKNTRNELAQKRCFIAELSKKVLDKYMSFDDIVADNTLSIYNLPMINEELNIIDFQINSLAVHVIPTIDRAKNVNVHIPKIYKQYNIKPDVIVFINFSKTLAKAEILGYITDVDLNALSIPKTSLLSANDLMDTILTLKPKSQAFSSNALSTTEELMLAYVDNDLSDEGQRFFFKHLIAAFEVRKNYKLFYALSCDFISIAKDVNIEKKSLISQEEGDTLLDEAMPEKIELFSRSSFLIDKAISKFNEEEIEDSEEEISSVQHSFYDSQQNEQETSEQNEETEDVINENTDENLENPEEETVAQTIPLFDEPEVAIAADDEEDMDEPVSLEEEEEFAPLGEEDLLLEDGEIEPLQEYEEESLQEEAHQEDLLVEEPVEEQESVLEQNSDDDDFLDIAEEANFDLLEEDVEALLEDENSFEQIEEVAQGSQEEKVVETIEETPENIQAVNEPDSGDDLFSFLSDLADENTQEQIASTESFEAEYQQTIQEQDFPQEEFVQEQQYIPQQEDQSLYQEVAQDDAIMQQQVQPDMTMSNMAFGQQPQVQPQPQQFASQNAYSQQPQAQRKSMAPLLMVLLLIGAAGYGIFNYKDMLLSKIGLTGDMVGLAEEDIMLPPGHDLKNTVPNVPVEASSEQKADASAPAPTDAPADTQKEATAQDAQAPAPQKDAPNKPANTAEKIPPANNAQALPALPTAVEPPKPKNINDAIAIALSKDFSGVRISRVSWEVSETLVENPEVKRYLTLSGKSIKNALAQDLMKATEPSFKESIKVAITYRKEGSIAKVVIDSSSGSQQIDDIVLKSVKDTLNFMKMPSLNLDTNEYTAKLTIGL